MTNLPLVPRQPSNLPQRSTPPEQVPPGYPSRPTVDRLEDTLLLLARSQQELTAAVTALVQEMSAASTRRKGRAAPAAPMTTKAAAWLRDELFRQQPLSWERITTLGERAGYKEATLRRARRRVAAPIHIEGRWFWRLSSKPE